MWWYIIWIMILKMKQYGIFDIWEVRRICFYLLCCREISAAIISTYIYEGVTAGDRDLHNAGATLLTAVIFTDSSHWCGWFGDVGREFPWEPQGCLWSHTHRHTHTYMNRVAHRMCWHARVSQFFTSTHCLSSLPSVSGACLCTSIRHHYLITHRTRFMK